MHDVSAQQHHLDTTAASKATPYASHPLRLSEASLENEDMPLASGEETGMEDKASWKSFCCNYLRNLTANELIYSKRNRVEKGVIATNEKLAWVTVFLSFRRIRTATWPSPFFPPSSMKMARQ
jgi:hypothetical protein